MTLAPRIERLLTRLNKPNRLILGLMSGTSLDGLDLALCRFSGHGAETGWEVLHWKTEPYAAAERERLRAVVSREQVSQKELTVLSPWLAERHAGAVAAALREWGVAAGEVSCLASHGQTFYHAPASWEQGGEIRHATLQLGDGDLLAVRTGIPTLSDFRQKEIAGGGQGAPLAPYGEQLLFGNAERARVLVNLGGIANFSRLPPAGEDAAPLSGDTGPANGLLDLAVRRYFPAVAEGFDRGGALAAAGRTHPGLLSTLKAHPYFSLPLPKSTGPEVFGADFLAASLATATRGTGEIPPPDLLATLVALTAETLAEALRREVPGLESAELFVSGGGRHNASLMARLGEALPGITVRDSAELGLAPDAKEAVLFAVLANETLWGEGFAVGQTPGALRLGFGKLSFPD